MPDLHTWISRQVDAVEERANACPPWPWTFDADDDAVLASDGVLVADIFALSGRQLHATGAFVAANDPAAALRRCAADRKILDRHCVDPGLADDWTRATVCQGCGVEGDCWDPVTENINDCPELLDLAAAHGLTDEILAQLDRPETPRREPNVQASNSAAPTVHTSAVPAALRGPNWKASR